MRTLVISDLHSNDEALRSVMSHVRRKGCDRLYCLGDLVGYGGSPNQVLDRIRAFRGEKTVLRGNHDRVASGADSGESFNNAARAAAHWTRDHLSGANRHFLENLALGPLDRNDVLLCHGSPLDEDEYLFTEYDAYRIFNSYPHPLIFFGHTHLPVIFEFEPPDRIGFLLVRNGGSFRLREGRRYLINPGSVGQPRDRNPRASFLTWDEEKRIVQFFRVEYDIDGARRAILKAGLPHVLADRLTVGS